REEELFKGRSETCVKYEFASKDLSKGAVRAGGYTVMQNYGMHCIHPLNNAVGITIDISRKAPPHIPSSKFDDIGERLLKSVSFVGFLE
ncbi:MAG: hypothetical protein KBT89_17195, partial [Gammaproteobacteria bacterium]|nr:hypothetical protein [Gammaproteobacteria bacterium]